MADAQSQLAADRIDRALARIEAALVDRRGAERPVSDDSLAKRHAALRHSMGEAVRALDGVLASQAD